MFIVENSVRLPAPLPRVWRAISEVDRFRFWHGLVAMKADPDNPRKIVVNFRKHPRIASDADIVRFEPPAVFAWRMAMKPLFEWQEEFHLERSPAGTQLTHRVQIRGWLSFIMRFVSKEKMRQSLETSDRSLGRYLAQSVAQKPGQAPVLRKR